MKIIIDEQLCTKIEMLQYEVNSRKEIITAYLQMNNTTSNLFKSYQDEYKQYFTEYNKAKQEMLEKYEVPANRSWHLDFATRELTY